MLSENSALRTIVRRHRLIAFGSVVVLLTLVVVAANLGRDTAPYALVFVPAVAALLVAGTADGLAGIARIVRRITRWRVAPVWYAAALGIPLLMWLGIAVGGFIVGDPPDEVLANLGTLPVVVLVVLIPGFIEEFGWRGYAVPASPSSWPLLVTGLVVGGLFVIPHLALYLPGGLYDNLPLWPLPLILLSYGVLFAWAFVGSGGSALIAALMHAASNGLTPLSRGIDPAMEWQLHGIVVTAIAVVVVLASARLRRPIGEADTGELPALAVSEAAA